MTFTPEVRERLLVVKESTGSLYPVRCDDVLAALTHIDALEAERNRLVAANESWHGRVTQEKQLRESYEERAEAAEARVAVLAAECRAWREYDEAEGGVRTTRLYELVDRRIATNRAGALEGGKP